MIFVNYSTLCPILTWLPSKKKETFSETNQVEMFGFGFLVPFRTIQTEPPFLGWCPTVRGPLETKLCFSVFFFFFVQAIFNISFPFLFNLTLPNREVCKHLYRSHLTELIVVCRQPELWVSAAPPELQQDLWPLLLLMLYV